VLCQAGSPSAPAQEVGTAEPVTIPEMVDIQGNVKVTAIPEYRPVDLAENLAEAALIVDATIVAVRSYLTADRTGIVTEISFVPNEFFRACETARSGATYFTLYGGKLRFANGTAEIVDWDFPILPCSRERYVLFLREAPGGGYYLVSGSRSAYRIIADRVFPSQRRDYPTFLECLGMPLMQLRQTISKP
jgi:hypothetical protein